MAKILTITLNPAIDATIELEQLRIGEVNRQQNIQYHAAGKGLNVAQVLHDLGHELIVSGFLGTKNQTLFKQHFKLCSLMTSLFISKVKPAKTSKLLNSLDE